MDKTKQRSISQFFFSSKTNIWIIFVSKLLFSNVPVHFTTSGLRHIGHSILHRFIEILVNKQNSTFKQ